MTWAKVYSKFETTCLEALALKFIGLKRRDPNTPIEPARHGAKSNLGRKEALPILFHLVNGG